MEFTELEQLFKILNVGARENMEHLKQDLGKFSIFPQQAPIKDTIDPERKLKKASSKSYVYGEDSTETMKSPEVEHSEANPKKFTRLDSKRVLTFNDHSKLSVIDPLSLVRNNSTNASDFVRTIINQVIDSVINDRERGRSSQKPRALACDHQVVMKRSVFVKEKVPSRSHSVQRNSKFTQSLDIVPNNSNDFYLKMPDHNDPRALQLKVYLLGTKNSITITVSKKHTVNEIVKHIHTVYKKSKDYRAVKELMYPEEPEAYELRFCDDDDEDDQSPTMHKPMLEIMPLERKGMIGNYGVDAVVFWPIDNYKPPALLNQKSLFFRRQGTIAFQISNIGLPLDSLKSSAMESAIPLKIHHNLDAFEITLNVKAQPTENLKDILNKLRAQRRELLTDYVFIEYNPEKTNEGSKALDILKYENQYLNMDIPLKNLRFREIKLVQRIYGDTPGKKMKKNSSIRLVMMDENPQSGSNVKDSKGLLRSDSFIYMDEDEISRFDSFEVVKESEKKGTKELTLLVTKENIGYERRDKEKSVPRQKRAPSLFNIPLNPFSIIMPKLFSRKATPRENKTKWVSLAALANVTNSEPPVVEITYTTTDKRMKTMRLMAKDEKEAKKIYSKIKLLLQRLVV